MPTAPRHAETAPPARASPRACRQDSTAAKSANRVEKDKRRSAADRRREEEADPYGRKSSGLKRLRRSIACALYMAKGVNELHKTNSSFVGGRSLSAGLEKRIYGLQEAQMRGLKLVSWEGV